MSGSTIGLVAIVAGPASAASSTVFLNSYNATNASNSFCSGANLTPSVTPPGCGSSVTVPMVLTNASSYTVTVAGAVSSWGSWPFRRCGKPDPSSEFASAGIASQPVGDDAQFRFAVPLYTGKCPKLPKKTSFFQVNLGGGWFHPVADGNPSKPTTDKSGAQHPYTFTLTGQGVAPQFRYIDYHSSDNSGRFKIVVTG